MAWWALASADPGGLEIELLALDAARGEYRVRLWAAGSPPREATLRVDWGAGQRTADVLRALRAAAPPPEDLRRWGVALGRALEASLDPALEAAARRGLAIRAGPGLAVEADAHALPWELTVYPPQPENPPLRTQVGVEIVHRIHAARRAPPPGAGTVLFAWSDAGGDVPWQQHRRALADAMAAAGLPEGALSVLRDATLPSVRARVEQLRGADMPVRVDGPGGP